ncbi:hypothetical protein NAL32_14020 [Chryseobacterium sp. Ch-15]|uniref:Uncharacterized protein n=1 Tax=Chryseobacterium muglaense TaxID=2893752 RepID=A0A9Q3UXK7_9FLAO|nr:hypothetical protein [Chryseobacterium muglaense]MBD3905829.1 hypothetical protein [Chryseobacterium muglaense]MCC9035786.1 hypothetical protein [Chryseobacterium muglaense]MCM2555496.1 hypothetical protein [Chryseobacterium muglaense]
MILVVIIFTIDYPLKEKTLYGMYVNTNYKNPICCVEAPHEPDTLILHSNGDFESRFFGRGQFEISNGINPRIELHYKSFGQSALFSTYFSNKLFEKPKIILNADMNHVYTKIN